MGWYILPPATGSGSGATGISDVTGTQPIVVTSPSSTTRNVALNRGIPGTFTSFPAGVMASFARRRIAFTAADNSASGALQNFAQATTATGAATGFTSVNTTFYTSAARIAYLTAASLNVRSGISWSNNPVFRGNVALTGGFILEMIFAFRAVNSTSRFFCGLTPTSTLPTLAADPSALTDVVGIAFDSADSNFQVMHNDSAGACTKVDLGANFPKPAGAALDRDVYYMMLFCAPNVGGTAQNVLYYLLRLDDTTKVTSGTLSTDLPTASTLEYQSIALGTGPSAAVAVELTFMREQCETTL